MSTLESDLICRYLGLRVVTHMVVQESLSKVTTLRLSPNTRVRTPSALGELGGTFQAEGEAQMAPAPQSLNCSSVSRAGGRVEEWARPHLTGHGNASVCTGLQNCEGHRQTQLSP